jgi:hypothetical protein
MEESTTLLIGRADREPDRMMLRLAPTGSLYFAGNRKFLF